MAYLRELGTVCQCGRRAVVEVFNRFNATQGKFCRACGNRRLRELERREHQEGTR
jgi:hypothetical protein